MKRSLFALGLTLMTASAFSATTATLVLKGTVAQLLDISIAPETVAQSLDLSNAASNLKVASVTEKSNSPTGYKILAQSANGAKLVNQSDANSFVNYSMTYDGSGISLNTSATQIFTTTSRGVNTKDLKITYSQPSNLSAGVYQDTLTFTIQAN